MDRTPPGTGRRLKWKDILAHPHGWIYGEKQYDQLHRAVRTDDGRVHVAPSRLLTEARRVLSQERAAPPEEFPFVLGGRRRLQSMNSWLNELPGLHKQDRTNAAEIHPDDATDYGLVDGDMVRVTSETGSIELPCRVTDAPKRGSVVVEHGWGSSILDPTGAQQPMRFGANRNVLVTSRTLDPLSQNPSFNTTPVRIDAVRANGQPEDATGEE